MVRGASGSVGLTEGALSPVTPEGSLGSGRGSTPFALDPKLTFVSTFRSLAARGVEKALWGPGSASQGAVLM